MESKLVSDFRPQVSSNRTRAKLLVTCSLLFLAVMIFPASGTKAQASFAPININLSYPQYQRLKLDGGYQYIDDGGMQGIILYRQDESTYIAYERLCSLDGEPAVSVDGSGLFMKGCNSTYSFSDGYPTGGPATRPLMKYRTSLTGNTLVITDELAY
ncbi:MAG: hypothetical protein HYZ44_05865 [Bacteroidetes bacterium]|nr:hypothetical protein [Bacteroidota bacterium]